MNKDVVRCCRHCGFGRGIWVRLHIQRIRSIASINRVQRIMDRRVRHGIDARLEDTILIGAAAAVVAMTFQSVTMSACADWMKVKANVANTRR